MRLEFFYGIYGFGDLRLLDGDVQIDDYQARCGSVGKDGKLKKPTPPGEYAIIEPSVDTTEPGMIMHPGDIGWKIRLYRVMPDGSLKFTHLLIHIDGGLGGSLGCIVIPGTYGNSLRHELDGALKAFGRIPVIVKYEAKA